MTRQQVLWTGKDDSDWTFPNLPPLLSPPASPINNQPTASGSHLQEDTDDGSSK